MYIDMSQFTYYQILEIPENATNEQIKAAYRSCLKKYHPDIYPGDKEEGREITEWVIKSYQVLSDEYQRSVYDDTLLAKRQQQQYAYANTQHSANNSNSYTEYRAEQRYNEWAKSQSEQYETKNRVYNEHAKWDGRDTKALLRTIIGIAIFALLSYFWISSEFQTETSSMPDGTVFYTPDGTCYHTKDCKTLKNSKNIYSGPIEYVSENHSACTVCNPNLYTDKEAVDPNVTRPSNGKIKNYTHRTELAPLEIETPSGRTDYYIILRDIRTKKPAFSIYVRGGTTCEVDVPIGNYELLYATGINWYGETTLFGKNTKYYKTDDTFYFTDDEDGYSGYTVTLIKQTGGNLETQEINPSEFLDLESQ